MLGAPRRLNITEEFTSGTVFPRAKPCKRHYPVLRGRVQLPFLHSVRFVCSLDRILALPRREPLGNDDRNQGSSRTRYQVSREFALPNSSFAPAFAQQIIPIDIFERPVTTTPTLRVPLGFLTIPPTPNVYSLNKAPSSLCIERKKIAHIRKININTN